MRPLFNRNYLMHIGPAGILLVLVTACSTCRTIKGAGMEGGYPALVYQEAYDVYPGVAGNGVVKHLVRSHTTAIMVRPVSSSFELGSRVWDEFRDVGRRLEIGLVKFPTLRRVPVPELPLAPVGMDLKAWEKRLDKLTGEPSSKARVEFIIDGEAFYEKLEKSIAEARHSIDVQTYLFDNDDVAVCIADQLRTRSKEIEVRVMYDGLGTYLSHRATADSQPVDYTPVSNMSRYLCKGSDVRLRVIPNTWLSGNHVKSMIFDRRTAFVGGMNVGREYRYDWHDMMIRLDGEAVGLLLDDFKTTWDASGWGGDFAKLRLPAPCTKVLPTTNEVAVRFLYTLPGRAQIYRAQLEAIRRARAYIYIENAYFADDLILYELCRARKRGVDVRVIMPAVVNHKIMEHSNRIAINTLLVHGARVYMYPEMSHVKAAVYDGWACMGTANFDKLSLQINRELNLATSHPETVKRLLDQLFIPDFKESTEVVDPIKLALKDRIIETIADEI